jgi:hypothetical protein
MACALNRAVARVDLMRLTVRIPTGADCAANSGASGSLDPIRAADPGCATHPPPLRVPADGDTLCPRQLTYTSIKTHPSGTGE